jgi:hypothetical protein
VVVLSDAFWRTRFGAAPDAIGRTIAIDTRPYTIVGVAPAGFQFPVDRVALWLPLGLGRGRIGREVTRPAGLEPANSRSAFLRALPAAALPANETPGTVSWRAGF